jgi:GNAT superfamily N-acetyltransferase
VRLAYRCDKHISPWTRSTALERHGVRRFPADVAPFLAIPEPCALAAATLDALVDAPVYLVGPQPLVPPGWVLKDLGPIVQMVGTAPLAAPPGPPPALLGAADRPAILDLAALVYPHYFRARTTALGTYRGVHAGGRLDAMIGERMALPLHREISAVCTHPSATGRGLARALLAAATNAIFARGETPFLHVSPSNTRALRLYEQNHYRTRCSLPFFSLRRA